MNLFSFFQINTLKLQFFLNLKGGEGYIIKTYFLTSDNTS